VITFYHTVLLFVRTHFDGYHIDVRFDTFFKKDSTDAVSDIYLYSGISQLFLLYFMLPIALPRDHL